jgi:hypothetical protein
MLEEPQVAIRILPLEREFQLQRDRLQSACAGQVLAKQLPMHRAAGAAGADQMPAAKLPIDHKPLPVGFDRAHRVLQAFGPGALEEPGIELDAADRMLLAARAAGARLEGVPVQAPEGVEAVRIARR